jgi:hypothetical protein
MFANENEGYLLCTTSVQTYSSNISPFFLYIAIIFSFIRSTMLNILVYIYTEIIITASQPPNHPLRSQPTTEKKELKV